MAELGLMVQILMVLAAAAIVRTFSSRPPEAITLDWIDRARIVSAGLYFFIAPVI